MALHTDLERPFRGKPRRIHDLRAAAGLNVFAAWTVAALTIDAFRQCCAENGLRPRVIVALRNLRVSVVAEHAAVTDLPPRWWLRGIEAWIQSQVAALFRIPRKGKFDENAARSSVKVTPDVIAGPHHIIDAQFLHVVGLAIPPGLPAALVNAVVSPNEAIEGIGSAVMIRLASRGRKRLGSGVSK